jgi:hypothetical protein
MVENLRLAFDVGMTEALLPAVISRIHEAPAQPENKEVFWSAGAGGS